jgi:hypothetical protein
VNAPAAEVWRWLRKIGQGRGGIYSYEWLENRCGLTIHNAAEIRPEWQQLAVGDQVRVVPPGELGIPDGYAFRVALVDPPRALVLRQQPPEHPWNATWRSSSNRAATTAAGCWPAAGRLACPASAVAAPAAPRSSCATSC